MKKSVLIFGISGFVGYYAAEEFSRNGYTIAGCDVVKSPSVPDYAEFFECDILNPDNVEKIINSVKPGYIINLAAVSSVGASWKNPQKTIAVNVEGVLNILEAARKCEELPKILLVGSSEEYAVSDKPLNEKSELNANNPYGISKAVQEQFAEMYRNRYGMKIYNVRPFNHTGVGQNDNFVIPSWCRQAAEIAKGKRAPVMMVGNLEVKRDFSDVRDIVRAYRMIIESEDCLTVYNVGSGNAVSLKELLDHIIFLTRYDVEINIDEELIRPTDNPYICCDNGLIDERLGWKPEYSIFDTVRELYDFYFNG